MSRLFLLALLAALAGCHPRLYDGSARPADEVALVRAEGTDDAGSVPGDLSFRVSLVRVDDRRLSGRKEVVEVLPGRHEIELHWTKYQATPVRSAYDRDRVYWAEVDGGVAIVALEAKAGREYSLDWNRSDPAGPPMRFRDPLAAEPRE